MITAGGITLQNTGDITSSGSGNLTVSAGGIAWTAPGTSDIILTGSGGLNITGNLTQTGTASGAVSLNSGNFYVSGTSAIYYGSSPQISSVSGTATFDGAVTLGINTGITAATATFNDTIIGATHSLGITGNAVFGNAVGDTVTGLTTLNVTQSSAIYTNTITSSGNQTYSGPATLYNTTTITSTTNGIITFGNTLWAAAAGTQGLNIDTTGNIVFAGNIGNAGTNRLGLLAISNAASSNITFSGNVYAVQIAQSGGTGLSSFASVVNTNAAAGINLTNVNISFADVVTTTGGGSVSLTHTGTLTMPDAADFSLTGPFTENGGGGVSLGAEITTTAATVNFVSPITLTNAVTIITTSGFPAGASVSFANTSTIAGAFNLSIDAGTGGNVAFGGTAGAANGRIGGVAGANRIGILSITNADNITFYGDVYAASVSIAGAGGTTTTSNTINTNTIAGININGTVFNIFGPITTTGGGPFTCNNAGLLTIAAAGDFTLSGAFQQVGTGNTLTSGDITVSASAASDAISFTGSVDINGTAALNSSGAALPIHFNSTNNIYFEGAATCNAGVSTITIGGDLHIYAPGSTISILSAMTVRNIVKYAGILNLNGFTLTTTRDLVLFGGDGGGPLPDYSADDTSLGAAGTNLFAYDNAARTAILPPGPILADPQAALLGTFPITGTNFTSVNFSGYIQNMGNITVGGNFYANGGSLIDLGWTLSIPGNNSAATSFAEAYNVSVDHCTATGGWVSAAENCTEITPASNTQWDFVRPQILPNDNGYATGVALSGTYTVYDNVVRVEFTGNIENSNNEISAAIANFSTNTGATVFTGSFTDAACTTSTNGAGDISAFYLQVNTITWNTDATGSSIGAAASTDRSNVHQTTLPTIDIPKALAGVFQTLRDEHKNRIAQTFGATRFTSTADRCRPVLIAVNAEQATHTYDPRNNVAAYYEWDAHNYFNLTWSEPVHIGPLAIGAAVNNQRSNFSFTTGAQTGGDMRMSGADLLVSGYFSALKAGINLSTGVRNGIPGLPAAPIAPDDQTANSLYRAAATPNQLRIYLAGFAVSLGLPNPLDWKYFWPGYIDDVTDPAGAGVQSASNAFITDAALNAIEPFTNDNAAYGATTYAKAAVVITTNPASPWDTTNPDITVYRTRTGWIDPALYYEASPVGFTGTGFMDRIEFHVFDDKPSYTDPEPTNLAYQWVSSQGWYAGNDRSAPVHAVPDNRGGLRSSSGLKSASTSPFSMTAEAFLFRPKIGSDPFTNAYNTAFTTMVTESLYNPAGSINVLDDPYFAVKFLPTAPWRMTQQMQFSYNASLGFMTDLAGLRLKGFASRDCVDKTPPQFTFTIQPMDTTSLYVLFSKPVNITNLHTQLLVLTDPMNPATNLVNASVPAVSKTGVSANGVSWDAIVTLTRPLTLTEIQGLTLKPVAISFTDPDTGAILQVSDILDILQNRMSSSEYHRVTDLGINLVMPLYASDGINTDGTFGPGEGALRTFDGTGRLLDKDITIATRINTGVTPAVSALSTLQLYYDVNPASATFPVLYNDLLGASLRLWLPAVLPSFNNASNFDSRSLNPKNVLDANQTFRNFLLSSNDSEIETGAKVEFLFKYGDLYCARLSDPNDVTSVDPWRFDISAIKLQRGGVTILNNVINSNKREKTILNIEMAKSGNLVIQVFTMDGNLLRTLERNKKGAGTYSYTWDGTNLANDPVARGMYFIRVVGPGMDEIRKVMVVKD